MRSLGHDLWEVRSNLSGSKIARVIFCVDEGRLVLLHGFIKKSQHRPERTQKIWNWRDGAGEEKAHEEEEQKIAP